MNSTNYLPQIRNPAFVASVTPIHKVHNSIYGILAQAIQGVPKSEERTAKSETLPLCFS